MPKLVEVERDYTAIHEKFTTIGPLLESQGMTTRGIRYEVDHHVERLRRINGVETKGVGKGQPRLDTDRRAADYILGLSGTTNGLLATEGFTTLERRTGRGSPTCPPNTRQAGLLRGRQGRPRAGHHLTGVVGVGVRRATVLAVHDQRRTAQAVAHPDRALPLLHRPRLVPRDGRHAARVPSAPGHERPLRGAAGRDSDGTSIAVRYLTPHNKWAIHSMYQENFFMMSLAAAGRRSG